MIKQLLAIIILSILVTLGMLYAQDAVQFIVKAHDWVADLLTQVFSNGTPGELARGLLALLAIPFAIAFMPVVVYWLARRKWFPYFMDIVWVVWLVQTAALVILYKTAA